MRKRFMVIFLAGGLVLGLWGCGSGGISAEAPAPAPAEGVGVPEDPEVVQEIESSDEAEARGNGPVNPGEAEASRLVETEATEPEVESEPTVESSTVDVDTSALLTEHAIEFEDPDGYRIRETIQLSPIFTEDDMETVYTLWEALGNDVSSFPSEDSLYSKSYLLRNMRDSGELEYIIGTYAIENLTDGFPITPDNPRNYNGALYTNHVSAFDEEHDGTASDLLNMHTVSMVMYNDGATYYGEEHSSVISAARMCSDTWGPCTFVVALPNMSTPNRPEGYRYDKTLILSTGMRFADEYDPITLEYYTKEVE